MNLRLSCWHCKNWNCDFSNKVTAFWVELGHFQMKLSTYVYLYVHMYILDCIAVTPLVTGQWRYVLYNCKQIVLNNIFNFPNFNWKFSKI